MVEIQSISLHIIRRTRLGLSVFSWKGRKIRRPVTFTRMEQELERRVTVENKWLPSMLLVMENKCSDRKSRFYGGREGSREGD